MCSKKLIVNHVWSDNIQSNIFSAVLSYHRKLSPKHIVHVDSIEPIDNADIWHYHRPHLEDALRPRSVTTVHHDLLDTDQWLGLMNFLPRYKEARRIICLNSEQEHLLKKQGIENTVIIPHGYHEGVISYIPKKKENNNKYTLLISSRRYGRRVKGEGYLIELLEYLNPEKVRFCLVGQDRSLDSYYMKKFGFEHRVYERLPYRMYGKLYQDCHFLLMPSFHEGGPASIPEAVASGTPVFCNPIGMAKDLIVNSRNGIWLSMNAQKDGGVINELLCDSDKLDDMFRISGSESTRSQAITWEQSVAKHCDLYEREIQ